MYTRADTGFSSGGENRARSARKFFCPPPELLRGGTGGGKGGQNLRGRGRFCIIYEMSLQENIKKKIFVPPLNHSGGGHFGCPPPELLRRGTILRGGTVPYFPPLYPLLCISIYIYIKKFINILEML